jgi:Fe-S cluster assembly iron-binding protein IscA
MTTTAAILDLVSVGYLTNTSVDWSDFFVAHSGEWRKVPFDDQCCRSFKMTTIAAILDLVSVYYLTNAGVDWLHLMTYRTTRLFHLT